MDTAKSDRMYPTDQVTGRVYFMSKKPFTDEQVISLKSNSCVARVSNLSVSFTEEFKRAAYGELLAGKPIWQIFKERGIDTDALGPVRVMSFKQFVYDCAKRGDGFKNMRNTQYGNKSVDDEAVIGQRVKNLENEVAYLRQVIEFLKKIQRADSGAKK